MFDSYQIWITSFLLVGMTVILIKEWAEISITIFSALILLIVFNIITIKEAFIGFSNIGVLSIGLLFVVAGSLQVTGAINQIENLIYGKKKTGVRRKLLRLMFPIIFFSSFINNTPIVAVLIPSVRSWAVKNNYSVSKFLLPLSFAAILGGMVTVIGTSTNLIVHGLLIDSGYTGFSFFEFAKIGIPIALFGIVYMIFYGQKMLSNRKEPFVQLGESTREFVIELKVEEEYLNIGKTIEESGLRNLKGLFLFQIERGNKIITPAKPDLEIMLNDRLFFTGLPETIIELQKTPGLQLVKELDFDLKNYDSDNIQAFEAVVSNSSYLVGKNIRESNFRSKFNAVIVAIHRNGERIKKKIGDIVVLPGDTLLILGDKSFRKEWYHSKEFYLISRSMDTYSKPQKNTIIASVVLIIMIVAMITEFLPIITAAGLAVIILIATKSISRQDAKNSIDLRVLIVIGSAFGIAHAIQNSGLAMIISETLIDVTKEFGPIGVIIGLYFLASLYTTFIISNASAALIFPIAITTAVEIGAQIHPFAITVAIASAASFATPISYQTNLMVYGPGGYKFTDFIKVGLPLQILTGILAVSLIYYFYF